MAVESLVLRGESFVDYVGFSDIVLLVLKTAIHLFIFFRSVVLNTSLVNLFSSWFVVSAPVTTFILEILTVAGVVQIFLA